jgi:TctA family transporter
VGDELVTIKDVLPYLIPLAVVEIVLLFIAIIDLDRRQYVTGNNKLVWVLVIVFVGIIGPIVYFLFGRRRKVADKQ